MVMTHDDYVKQLERFQELYLEMLKIIETIEGTGWKEPIAVNLQIIPGISPPSIHLSPYDAAPVYRFELGHDREFHYLEVYKDDIRYHFRLR